MHMWYVARRHTHSHNASTQILCKHVPVAEINDELQDMIQEPHFNACGKLCVSEWVSVEATHNLFVEHIHTHSSIFRPNKIRVPFKWWILLHSLWRAKHILLVYSIQIMFTLKIQAKYYISLCVYFISNWFGTNAFKLLFGSWSLKTSNIHMTYLSTCFPISFFNRKYTKGCYFFTWIHLIKATGVLLCNCSWFLLFLVQVGEQWTSFLGCCYGYWKCSIFKNLNFCLIFSEKYSREQTLYKMRI